MIVLGTSETITYFSAHTFSSLFIGTTHRSDVFHANLDITFPHMPCDIIGLNYRDSLENAVNDYFGEIHKHRLDRNGKDVGVESWGDKTMNRNEIKNLALKEFEKGQGCRFEGYIEMNRVPGFFFISAQEFSDILHAAEEKGYFPDLTFKIDHFSFGKKQDFQSIKSHFPATDVHHPLDGFSREAKKVDWNKSKRPANLQTSFFIEAVPSTFKSALGSLFDTEVF